jgi:LacI family transcriptional regulator
MRRVLLLLGANFRQIQDGVIRFARENHWTLDFSYVRGGQLKYTFRLDGIVGLLTNPRDLDALKQLPPLPLVNLSAAMSMDELPNREGVRTAYVLPDDKAIGRMAAQYFIGRGFRHLVFYNVGNFWMERARRETFMQTAKGLNRVYHELKHYEWEQQLGGKSSLELQQAILKRLEKELVNLPKPAGLMAPSDDFAVVILQACEAVGLRVPEEIAVLGCHNLSEVCESAPVPLSSVDDDLELQGYEAASLLDKMIDGEIPSEKPVFLPPKGIVTRTSTDILAVPHLGVARALRFIWEHYTEPIQVSDLAQATSLSRRSLARLFQKFLNRSVGEEITRKRIDRAKELLLNTDFKAWQIADMSGFSSMEHLSKAFTRVVGQPPSVFRDEHRGSQ